MRPNHSLKRGPATAGRLGPVGGTRYIFANRAKPPCRSGPLSSNVRPRVALPFVAPSGARVAENAPVPHCVSRTNTPAPHTASGCLNARYGVAGSSPALVRSEQSVGRVRFAQFSSQCVERRAHRRGARLRRHRRCRRRSVAAQALVSAGTRGGFGCAPRPPESGARWAMLAELRARRCASCQPHAGCSRGRGRPPPVPSSRFGRAGTAGASSLRHHGGLLPRPNPSLKRRPATAATVWPLQAILGNCPSAASRRPPPRSA